MVINQNQGVSLNEIFHCLNKVFIKEFLRSHNTFSICFIIAFLFLFENATVYSFESGLFLNQRKQLLIFIKIKDLQLACSLILKEQPLRNLRLHASTSLLSFLPLTSTTLPLNDILKCWLTTKKRLKGDFFII